MRSCGVAIALLLVGSAGAQIIETVHRAATPAQRASLKAYLRPRIASGELDGSSLELDAWRDKNNPKMRWQVEATAWTPSARTGTGLCTAQQLGFKALDARLAWQPADPPRVRYVWQAGPSDCKRKGDLVRVEEGLDEARVAAIVRDDNHLHDGMLAMAKATCWKSQTGLHLVGIDRESGVEPRDHDPYPKLGVVMNGDHDVSVPMSIRFGPRGPEPWHAAGCLIP